MDRDALNAAATTLRMLTIDAVERSTTGHPGMAMGCADLGAVLYGEILKHTDADLSWIDRDRFVLSAGHGAILLYSLIHLAGFGLPLEELKNLRRIGSLTPGHPEYGLTPGVEATTGPLGTGFAAAVGMAMAERMLAHRFNTAKHTIIDHFTYVLSGDGCLMEGIASEAASLAGHHKLGKLIVYYDSNDVSIEGSTSITFTEDVCARFRAYGWQTLNGNAHDMEEILRLTAEAKAATDRPTLIELKSIIGKGAPTMEGGHKIHGAPLGRDEILAARRALGVPEDKDFFVHPDAARYFEARRREWKKTYDSWLSTFAEWSAENPDLRAEYDRFMSDGAEYRAAISMPTYAIGDTESSRDTGGRCLAAVAAAVPNLIGGSADLAPTTKTDMGTGDFTPDNPGGRTIRFGVREHAMASIANGFMLHGGFRIFCGTLVIFSDFMRPPMRLAALMELPVIYVLTHDSVLMGGDGPTHQPVEQISTLRMIPNFRVLRPGDPEETAEAWLMALERLDGPSALILSRQGLTVYPKADREWRKTMRRGAYTVLDAEEPELILVATGSEVAIARAAAEMLTELRVRIVSMVSRELFLAQDRAFRDDILPPGVRVVAVEAGTTVGWERITGVPSDVFGIDRFGVSGPGDDAAEYLGFTAERLVELCRNGAESRLVESASNAAGSGGAARRSR